MLGTALEFAAGTTDDCKRLIASLFQPGDVLAAYRVARRRFGTPDVVLVTKEGDASGFEATPRVHFVERLRRGMGRNAGKLIQVLGIASQSAHAVAKLPANSEAIWLVVNRKDALPLMVVMFSAPYATDDDAREPVIQS